MCEFCVFIKSIILLLLFSSTLLFLNVICMAGNYCLRNKKYFPCFYQVIETEVEVWKNEKCCGNMSRRQVFPQLFWVLPNFLWLVNVIEKKLISYWPDVLILNACSRAGSIILTKTDVCALFPGSLEWPVIRIFFI